MKEHMLILTFIICMLLLVLNVVGVGVGAIDHSSGVAACEKKHNVDYLIPGYRFGCWLGEERK